MKLRLTIFLIGLLITAFGIGALVDALTQVPLTTFPRSRGEMRSTGAGSGAGFATFGIGVAIGVPLILWRRKPKQ